MRFKDLYGNWLLLKFYIESVVKLHKLPLWMRNPDEFVTVVGSLLDVKQPRQFQLSVGGEVAREYNEGFDRMKVGLRRLHAGDQDRMTYRQTLLLLFLIRLGCLYTAAQGNLAATLVLSSVQFLAAPYSLFVSLALAIALAPPIYLSHYLVFSLLSALSSLLSPLLSPLLPFSQLTIGPTFIFLFFLYDQLCCLYCNYVTPAKHFTLRDTLVHAVWGFLNTKTYTLVLLIHMMKAEVTIPVLLWLLDWKLELTLKVSTVVSSRLAHWLELFYTQHRIAHLPKVYEHAHKLHHFLHGTLAFDAHIYGNGMPEEFFFMLLELTMGVQLGVMPASLNRLILQYSWDNKNGHTQKPEDTAGENFHADHHLVHTKNYGIYNSLMDMYFNTATSNHKYRVRPGLYCPGAENIVLEVEKKVDEEENVVFLFTPLVIKAGEK